MATTFSDILNKGKQNFQTPNIAKTARDWYRKQAKNVVAVDERQLMRKRRYKQTTQVEIGNMYMFYYDPKHKNTLPYYDKFPLIFPIDSAPGGFYGLALHYLYPTLRAKLMDHLYDLVTDTKYDKQTKLRISYQILKNASKLYLYKPCIKHYLNNHVRSKFLYVEPKEWDIALMLPTERFEKASNRKVWNDSRRKL